MVFNPNSHVYFGIKTMFVYDKRGLNRLNTIIGSIIVNYFGNKNMNCAALALVTTILIPLTTTQATMAHNLQWYRTKSIDTGFPSQPPTVY